MESANSENSCISLPKANTIALPILQNKMLVHKDSFHPHTSSKTIKPNIDLDSNRSLNVNEPGLRIIKRIESEQDSNQIYFENLRISESEWEIVYLNNYNPEIGLSRKEHLILQLFKLGFPYEKIQDAVFETDVENLEEILYYIIRDNGQKWEHKFVDNKKCSINKEFSTLCYYCRREKYYLDTLISFKNDKLTGIPVDRYNVVYSVNRLIITNDHYKKKLEAMPRQNTIETDDNDISYVSNKHSLEDYCFACKYCLESHSIDYNLNELYNETTFIKLNENRHKLPKVLIRNNSGLVKYSEPAIKNCIICLERNISLIKFPCNHLVCSECLKTYLLTCINDKNQKYIKCPEFNCYQEIPEAIIANEFNNDNCFEKYKIRKLELKYMKLNQLFYCPACSRPNFIMNSDISIITCRSCNNKFCAKCRGLEHPKFTCEEHLITYYSLIVRGWNWQTCPRCKEPVKVASVCRHMVCNKCHLKFCIYCRREGTCNGIRCNLKKPRFCDKFSYFCYCFCVYMIMILLSPIFALFVVPYIFLSNIKDNLTQSPIKFDKPLPDPQLSGAQYLITPPNANMPSNKKSAITFKKNKSCICFRLFMVGLLAVLLSPISFIGIIMLGIWKIVEQLYYLIF